MAKLRDNIGRFQKRATVNITKELQKIANDTKVNVQLVVADNLEEKFKNNVFKSYYQFGERSAESLGYEHTNIFEQAIYTTIDGDDVKIMIDDSEFYNNGKTAVDIYEYLTKGTNGGGDYTFINKKGDMKVAYNYPTPIHPFEEWTKLEMNGFLDSLVGDIKNGKYTTYRYTGKKKPREYYTYKGQRIEVNKK